MRFLDKYAGREKELRRLAREVARLSQAQRNAPVVPLERPYHRGWIKTYVLEDRVSRRPDAQILRTILHTVNRTVYSRDRSFLTRGGRAIELYPRIIFPREWAKLNWPASHQRFFAFGMWRIDDPQLWHLPGRVRRPGYNLAHADWLREEVQPFLITHQRVMIPDVESRLAEIETHMTHTHGWQRLLRLRGRRVSSWQRLIVSRAEYQETADRTDQLRQLSLIDT